MSEPIWIEIAAMLAIHDRQLVEHGGTEDPRAEALLSPGMDRLLNRLIHAGSDIIELATTYMAGIVQNRPFVDANKRTAFVVGVLFLELNGYRFRAREEAAAQAVLEFAAGTVDEKGLCAFLRTNVDDERNQKPPRHSD